MVCRASHAVNEYQDFVRSGAQLLGTVATVEVLARLSSSERSKEFWNRFLKHHEVLDLLEP